MNTPDLFKVLGNAEEFIESQRETLNDEQKKEFDNELEKSGFKDAKKNLSEALNSLSNQLSSLANGNNH